MSRFYDIWPGGFAVGSNMTEEESYGESGHTRTPGSPRRVSYNRRLMRAARGTTVMRPRNDWSWFKRVEKKFEGSGNNSKSSASYINQMDTVLARKRNATAAIKSSFPSRASDARRTEACARRERHALPN